MHPCSAYSCFCPCWSHDANSQQSHAVVWTFDGHIKTAPINIFHQKKSEPRHRKVTDIVLSIYTIDMGKSRLFPLAVLHAHSGLITYALLVRTADTPWGVSPLRDRSYWTFNDHVEVAPLHTNFYIKYVGFRYIFNMWKVWGIGFFFIYKAGDRT